MSKQQLAPEEHLYRSLEFIRTQEGQMRRAFEANPSKVLLALKHASTMLSELRTSVLSPKAYYELYNACFDALSQLQTYLVESHDKHHFLDMYQVVELTGNVLPRLYLMITVGTAYLGSGDAPDEEVLKDLLEMSRGIQQPLRGLFLRYYLGQRTGNFLSTKKVNTAFGIQFTLTNFIEMNKLWVRYQHQGLSRDREKRVEERRQLQTVVGSSILRLAQLDTVNITMFADDILPPILEQVVRCRDKLAQEYLLDVVVEAFPAEYHIETLEQYVDIIGQLVPETSKRLILMGSMNKVIDYATSRRETLVKPEHSDNSNIESQKPTTGSPSAGVEASEEQGEAHAENGSTDNKGDGKTLEQRGPTSTEETSVPAKVDSGESTPTESLKDAVPGETGEAPKKVEEAEEDAGTSTNDPSSEKDLSVEPNSETNEDKDNDKEAGFTKNPSSQELIDQVESSESAQGANGSSTNDVAANNHAGTDDTAGSPDLISFAINVYWTYIRELELSLDDRAALVRKLIELLNVTGLVKGPVLSQLLEFAIAEINEQSVEVEMLLLALFDSELGLSEILSLLKEYPSLLSSQSRNAHHMVAEKVVDTLLQTGDLLSDVGQAQQVFELFTTLVRAGGLDTGKVTQLLHLLKTDAPATSLELLQLAQRSLRDGGPPVVRRTYSVLINATVLLLRESPEALVVSRILGFASRMCHDLATIGDSPLTAYRLYLLAATAADFAGAEEASYELVAQALTLYEEQITDSAQQLAALAIVTHSLQRVTVFTSENYAPLAERCVQYSQRLLKKPDQCRMLLMTSHLYWDNPYSDDRRVGEILTRALRSADSVMDARVSIELFLDVLDANLYYLGANTVSVTVDGVNSLLKLIAENFETAEGDDNSESNSPLRRLHERYAQTVKFVKAQQETFAKYQELEF